MADDRADRIVASLYDATVPDWPGELEFYHRLVASTRARNVLEIACGTGRIALRLAGVNVRVTGFDRSAEMLDVARRKGSSNPSVRWVEADMRWFDLGRTFELAISPGHSFQYMTTLEDQLACLDRIRRHLVPGGTLVLHVEQQDLEWLGELRGGKGGESKTGDVVTEPSTGRRFRASRAWTYEPSTQTATSTATWEELDAGDRAVGRWTAGPNRLHCYFPFEMRHLLARAGFDVEAVYGDFARGTLADDSREMIWVARAPGDRGPTE